MKVLPPTPIHFLPNTSDYILCCYQNDTSQFQILRISNIPNWSFEKVAAPLSHVIFEAPLEAQLEVHTGTMATAILSDKMLCKSLKMIVIAE